MAMDVINLARRSDVELMLQAVREVTMIAAKATEPGAERYIVAQVGSVREITLPDEERGECAWCDSLIGIRSKKTGAANRIRTCDPVITNDVHPLSTLL